MTQLSLRRRGVLPSLVLAACAAAPAAALTEAAQEGTAGEERPRHAPSPERTVEVRARETTDLSAVRLRIVSNGRVTDRTDYLFLALHELERAWTDIHEAGSEDEPRRLTRRIERATDSLTLDTEQRESEATGKTVAVAAQEGAAVTFVWDADEGHYTPDAIEDDGGATADADLAALAATPTFAAFLPPGTLDLEEGATWSVEAEALREALRPGGPLPRTFERFDGLEDPDLMAFAGGLNASRACDTIDGAIEATWVGIEEEDGRRLARIAVEVDVELEADVTDWMHVQSEPYEMAGIGQAAEGATVTGTLKGEGALTWDLEANRFTSFRLEADSSYTVAMAFDFAIGSFELVGDYRLETAGGTTLELTAE